MNLSLAEAACLRFLSGRPPPEGRDNVCGQWVSEALWPARDRKAPRHLRSVIDQQCDRTVVAVAIGHAVQPAQVAARSDAPGPRSHKARQVREAVVIDI